MTEQRTDRLYFTNYVDIADVAARQTPEHRRAIAAETFRVAQMAKVSSAGAAIAATAARLAASGSTGATMIREQQDMVQQWRRLDGALDKAASRPPAERRPDEEASLRAALADVTQRLDSLDAQIASEFPAYAELSNPRPLQAEGVQALLAGDEALMVYLTTNEATWLWVLRHDDLALYRIKIGAATLTSEVKLLRESLDPTLNPGLAPFPASRTYALYQKLIGPAEPLLARVHHLLIVPDGALQSLPMTVLVTKAPQQDTEHPDDYRDIAWLARDYAVTVLPAVSSLRALRQFANSEHASAPFLGVGDPVLNGIPASMPIATLASLWHGAIVKSMPSALSRHCRKLLRNYAQSPKRWAPPMPISYSASGRASRYCGRRVSTSTEWSHSPLTG